MRKTALLSVKTDAGVPAPDLPRLGNLSWFLPPRPRRTRRARGQPPHDPPATPGATVVFTGSLASPNTEGISLTGFSLTPTAFSPHIPG